MSTAPEQIPPGVKLLDDAADPFTNTPKEVAGVPATLPATRPAEGRSVSSTDVTVSDAGTVEIHVNDANLVEVLRMLSLQSQKNIIASKDVRGTITANLYDVTVRDALDAILHANGYAYREKNNFVYVYTAKELAEIEQSERRVRTEIFRVYYTPAVNAANMIKPALSAAGQVAVTTPALAGISSTPDSAGGNDHASDDMLVVTDYDDNLAKVKKILAEVDRRPQQILLEATILRASLNDDNALGIDFNILSGVNFANILSNSGQIGNATLKEGTGVTGRASSVGTGNSFSSPISGGMKVGFVSNDISVFLSALEQVTDTTILANPKILTLNKQKGEVFVGNEDGYKTTLTTETTSSETVETLKTGTRLIFRPYIASDGYIRLEVHPEDSDGQVKANGLPSKTTTEITSDIMVKDGHTVVIGGLFRESSVSGRSQVPGLGNIPVAGALFRSQNDRTVREEVIILLTPHIVKDDTQYSKLSEEEQRRGEQLRVGVRKQMMWWGRERLAETSYESARRELNKPNPNRSLAMWHLDCATNLNPQFSEAILLKEQTSGREVSGVYSSTIKSFVRRSIMSDLNGPTTAPAVVPIDAPPPSVRGATTLPAASAEAPAPATEPALAPSAAAAAAAAAPATRPAVAVGAPPAVAGNAPASGPAPWLSRGTTTDTFGASIGAGPAAAAGERAGAQTVTELPTDAAVESAGPN